jgi:transcriptional regulator with XRE-family HTH domain
LQLFSQNIYTIRKSWNLSQAELAEKFGVATGSYSRWENGTEPTYETLVQIAAHFKISIDRLLTEELTPQTCPPRWGGREYPAQEGEVPAVKEPSREEELMSQVLSKIAELEAAQQIIRDDIATLKTR